MQPHFDDPSFEFVAPVCSQHHGEEHEEDEQNEDELFSARQADMVEALTVAPAPHEVDFPVKLPSQRLHQ
jgi:hypothetical protein